MWQEGACMAGGMHGRGMRDRGHAWWGVCMAGDMCGGGCAWQGGVWGRGRAGQERRPLQRTVRILLECILVFDKMTL